MPVNQLIKYRIPHPNAAKIPLINRRVIQSISTPYPNIKKTIETPLTHPSPSRGEGLFY